MVLQEELLKALLQVLRKISYKTPHKIPHEGLEDIFQVAQQINQYYKLGMKKIGNT